jgi:hypothetical protein
MKKLVCESLDELYENYILNEEEYEYTGGEKAALTRGDDILTKTQLAAMYLAAKDAAGRSEDTRGRGDSGWTRNALKMNKEDSTDFHKLSAPRLADVLGLKPQTVIYTVSKFRLLLKGNREGTESNVLYNKIIDAFDEFQKMPAGDVHTLALEAVDMNASTERSEKYYDETHEQGKKSRENINTRNKKIGFSAIDLYNRLRNAMGEKTPKMVINKLATEYSLPAEDIRTIIKTHLKNDPNLARKF